MDEGKDAGRGGVGSYGVMLSFFLGGSLMVKERAVYVLYSDGRFYLGGIYR